VSGVDPVPLILLLALQGLVIGAFARLALPGPDPMSIPETMAVGLGGSLIAGVIFYALAGAAPGFLASLVFATLIVYVVRRRRGGGLSDPGPPPGGPPR
jgi:uncharacterized membrane protein YeaQ/YmgE (transglycosylase-associated protein family)